MEFRGRADDFEVQISVCEAGGPMVWRPGLIHQTASFPEDWKGALADVRALLRAHERAIGWRRPAAARRKA